MGKIDVFSYGGGRQGIAICALIVQGRLPKPDAIVIADTGREKQSTWDYLQSITQPALRKIGLEVEVAPHSLATVDVYGKNGDILIPMFVSPAGKLSTYCSNEWKRRVVQRWFNQRYGNESMRSWIGYSVDELYRVNEPREKKYSHWYPLIEEVRCSSADCVSLVEAMGWPTPKRSSCWMCPHLSNQEWRDLPPAEMAKAIELEVGIRNKDDGLYLHRALQPLSQVELYAQTDLFEDVCKTGYCFT